VGSLTSNYNNMKKSAKEWFEHLPEPIRSQAVENWEDSRREEKHDKFNSLVEALDTFPWAKTSQGFSYWNLINFRAKLGEFDQPEPNLHGWISVADRLPTQEDGDEGGDVLVLLTPNKIPKKTIFAWQSLQNASKETHWQPLPKLPEVKGGEND